jgi:TonB-dependent receptor
MKKIKEKTLTRAIRIALLGACFNAPQALAQEIQTESQNQTETQNAEVEKKEVENESDAVETILVTGRKLDSILSIDAKRYAKRVVDTISADEASRLPDNNIAESLSRIAGVTFERSFESGNGNFISIRGLDSALNNIQFDGANAAVASSGARRTPLDGITADDIAELRVAKSLLPQDEGVGIGGSVEIISNSPLRRGRDRFNYTLEGRDQEFNDRFGYRAATGITKIFNDNFGIDFSASFRRREINNYQLNESGSNIITLSEFRGPNGEVFTAQDIVNADNGDLFDTGTAFDNVPSGSIDPLTLGFEDVIYETQEQTRDTITLATAIDYRTSENTLLTLNGRYNRQDTDQTENNIQFDSDENDFLEDENGDVVLVDGQLVNTFDGTEVEFRSQLEDEINENITFSIKGETSFEKLRLDYQVNYANASREFIDNFDTTFVAQNLIGNGEFFVGNPFTANVGRLFLEPNPGIFSADANPDFAALVADPANNLALDDAITQDQIIENDRYAFKFDAEYDLDAEAFGGRFGTIRTGVKFERSEVSEIDREFIGQPGEFNLDGTLSFNENGGLGGGTSGGSNLSDFVGFFNGVFDPFQPAPEVITPSGFAGIPIFDVNALRNFNQVLAGQVRANPGILDNNIDTNVQEDVTAFYVQSEFEIGKLLLIGGVRVEHYEAEFEVAATNFAQLRIENLDPNDPDNILVTNLNLLNGISADNLNVSVNNTEVLPRITGLYQVSETFQIRGGYGESLARPSIDQLATETDTNINLVIERANQGDTPFLAGVNSLAEVIAAGGFTLNELSEDVTSIDIESGNPNLENAQSTNFDLSFEYYPVPGSSITLGFFYKDIDNFIFVNEEPTSGAVDVSVLESLLSAETLQILEPIGGIQSIVDAGEFEIDVQQPRNGETATVKGLELGLNHQFDWAPGLLANMGMSANFTYTESDAIIPVTDELEDDEALVILGLAQEGDALTRRTPFFNAPRRSANASLYYEDNKFEVAISGLYQDRSFNAVDDFGLDQFDIQFFAFDFYVEYKLPKERFGNTSISFEVPDFTDSGRKSTTGQSIGTNRRLFDNASFNGREFRLTLRSSF